MFRSIEKFFWDRFTMINKPVRKGLSAFETSEFPVVWDSAACIRAKLLRRVNLMASTD